MRNSRPNQPKTSPNRFLLIDGHAILHRAYHALPPLTSRSGELLNAVYGFTTMLFKVISDLKPKYLAVAFDTPKPTFRQMEYVGYQAQRPEMEAKLSSQIGRVYEILQSMGILIFAKEGFEADDVIGTLTRKAVQNKLEVVIVTGDRDMMQLVGPRVRVYAPVKGLSEGQFFDEERVKKEIGVRPEQIADFKGLTGDSSDNYPGVPGIGPKTAIDLLKRFGTLDKLYKNLSEVGKFFNPRVVAKLSQGEELARLSKKLATIVTNVPLKVDLEKCKFEFTDKEKEKTIKKLEELKFKSLVPRLSDFGQKKGLPRAQKGAKSKSQRLQEDFQKKLF